METKLNLNQEEKERFRNIKMLQEVYNALGRQMKRYAQEIERYNNAAVRDINVKYDVTITENYTFDEVNEQLLHCLANIGDIDSKIIKVRPRDEFELEAEHGFSLLLKSLSVTYREMHKKTSL